MAEDCRKRSTAVLDAFSGFFGRVQGRTSWSFHGTPVYRSLSVGLYGASSVHLGRLSVRPPISSWKHTPKHGRTSTSRTPRLWRPTLPSTEKIKYLELELDLYFAPPTTPNMVPLKTEVMSGFQVYNHMFHIRVPVHDINQLGGYRAVWVPYSEGYEPRDCRWRRRR